MLAFVLKRLALVVPTFLGITLLVFSLIRLIPGDPVEALSGERGMTPERYQRLFHGFGVSITNGDAYSSAWCRTAFERRAIQYRHCELPRTALYLNLLP